MAPWSRRHSVAPCWLQKIDVSMNKFLSTSFCLANSAAAAAIANHNFETGEIERSMSSSSVDNS